MKSGINYSHDVLLHSIVFDSLSLSHRWIELCMPENEEEWDSRYLTLAIIRPKMISLINSDATIFGLSALNHVPFIPRRSLYLQCSAADAAGLA